jgi:Calx-beta domain-containing protein/FG-GAP repeat protein
MRKALRLLAWLCVAGAAPLPLFATDSLPKLTIDDVVTREGEIGGGPKDAIFTVTMTGTGGAEVDVSTQDLTATAGTDYASVCRHLVFAGAGTQQVRVPIFADHLMEGDETFYVNLTSPIGATIVDGTGHGAIQDDDFVSTWAKCDLNHNGRSNLLVSFEHTGDPEPPLHTPLHQDVGVTGTIPDVTLNSVEYRKGVDPDWQLLAMDDFDGDGNCDLFWTLSGTLAITLGTADGHMEAPWDSSQYLPMAHPGEGWVLVGSGSFDGDAKKDVMWWNADLSRLEAWVWRDGILVAQPVTGFPADPFQKPIGIAHLTGAAGFSGVIWQKPSGEMSYWQLNGTVVETSVPMPNLTALEGPLPRRLAAIGDFNGDGYDDLIWQYQDREPSIWFMRGNQLVARSLLSSGQIHFPFPGHTPGSITGPR